MGKYLGLCDCGTKKKSKIVCGAQTPVKITTPSGVEIKYDAICGEKPGHRGKHREITEWDV